MTECPSLTITIRHGCRGRQEIEKKRIREDRIRSDFLNEIRRNIPCQGQEERDGELRERKGCRENGKDIEMLEIHMKHMLFVCVVLKTIRQSKNTNASAEK